MLEFTNLGGVRVLIHKDDGATRLNRLGMTHQKEDVRPRKSKRGNPERTAS